MDGADRSLHEGTKSTLTCRIRPISANDGHVFESVYEADHDRSCSRRRCCTSARSTRRGTARRWPGCEAGSEAGSQGGACAQAHRIGTVASNPRARARGRQAPLLLVARARRVVPGARRSVVSDGQTTRVARLQPRMCALRTRCGPVWERDIPRERSERSLNYSRLG